MPRIGLTGGIACGKSLVGSFLEAEGAAVRDADNLAHEVMRKGTAVYVSVVKAFGRDILGADEEIDRAVLGSLVFGDATARAELNRLVHPEVIRRMEEWLDQCVRDGRPAVAMVPLLFETGWNGCWDRTICVAAPYGRTLEWLNERGVSGADAERRIRSQMPLARKMARSDCVIFNCGTVEMLRHQAQRVWRHIIEEAKEETGDMR